MTRKPWTGWRIGGLTLMSRSWSPVRGYRLIMASWHNPKRTCWLWIFEASWSAADELRAFRAYSLPGAQARYTLQLWSLNLTFTWQVSGQKRAVATR